MKKAMTKRQQYNYHPLAVLSQINDSLNKFGE